MEAIWGPFGRSISPSCQRSEDRRQYETPSFPALPLTFSEWPHETQGQWVVPKSPRAARSTSCQVLPTRCSALSTINHMWEQSLPHPYQADGRIEFVDRAQTSKYVVIFVESLSSIERTLALIARLGIYLHHWSFLELQKREVRLFLCNDRSTEDHPPRLSL